LFGSLNESIVVALFNVKTEKEKLVELLSHREKEESSQREKTENELKGAKFELIELKSKLEASEVYVYTPFIHIFPCDPNFPCTSF
jgi:hypothetical protein